MDDAPDVLSKSDIEKLKKQDDDRLKVMLETAKKKRQLLNKKIESKNATKKNN